MAKDTRYRKPPAELFGTLEAAYVRQTETADGRLLWQCPGGHVALAATRLQALKAWADGTEAVMRIGQSELREFVSRMLRERFAAHNQEEEADG